MQEIETILLKSCAAQPVKPSTAPQAMYKVDINFTTLEFHLKMMPDLIETGNKQHQMGIKKVAFLRTFSTIVPLQKLLCEVLVHFVSNCFRISTAASFTISEH